MMTGKEVGRWKRGCTAWIAAALGVLSILGCDHPDTAPPNSSAAAPVFTDVTEEAGLGGFRHVTGSRGDVWFPETMGSGGGFFDYDGDGYPDVLLVGGGTWPPDAPVQALWLYRNRGDGTFENVSDAAGLADLHAYGMGVTTADYDDDGDQDIYLTTVGENRMLRNEQGVFRDVTAASGVGGGQWSTSALFLDGDEDGRLDLLVGNYVAWSPETEIPCPREDGRLAYCTPETYEGVPPTFYRNRGDGTFEDRSAATGFAPSPGKTLGVAALDFNDDGRTDVAMANDTEADQLYENQGDGTFVDVGLLAGIAFDEQGNARAGMGIDTGDLDGDGRTSIVVGNFASEMTSVFRYEGQGIFRDRTATSRIGAPSLPSLTFGLILFDADLDGDLDVLAANGHIDPDIERYRDNSTFRQRANLFLNDGDGYFDDAAAAAGPDDALSRRLVARGTAYADVDDDGDLDVLLTENGGGARLWRNETRSGENHDPNYLRVRLVGVNRNLDALGASVVAVSAGLRQERRVRTGGSYLSVSEKVVTFGFGDAGTVDTLIVTWPDGAMQKIPGVPANPTLTLLQEPASTVAQVP